MATSYKLPEQLKKAEAFLKQCEDGGQSDYSIVLELHNIADMCVNQGIRSERICMKTDTGVAEVVERFAATAVTALSQIHRMKQDAIRVLEKADAPDPVINLIVQETRLEDILG